MDISIPQKRCNKCLQFKDATPENFVRHRSMPDGFTLPCKACRHADYRAQHPLTEAPIPQGYKRCTTCRVDLLATTDFFHRNKAQESGLNNECKACKNARSKVYDQSPQVRGNRLIRQNEWNKSHKEYLRAYSRTWNQVNRESVNVYSRVKERNRRARQHAAPGTHTVQDIQAQYERQKGKCYYCGVALGKKRGGYTVDHTFPLAREGARNDISHLVIACPACNRSKSDKFPWEWPQGGRLL